MNRDDIQEHAFKTVLAQYKLAEAPDLKTLGREILHGVDEKDPSTLWGVLPFGSSYVGYQRGGDGGMIRGALGGTIGGSLGWAGGATLGSAAGPMGAALGGLLGAHGGNLVGTHLATRSDALARAKERAEAAKTAGFLSGGVRSGHALSNAASSAWNVASNLNTAGKNLQVPIGQRWGDVASNSWRHFNEQGGGKALGDLAMRGGAVAGTAALAGGALRATGVGGQQQPPPNPYYPQR